MRQLLLAALFAGLALPTAAQRIGLEPIPEPPPPPPGLGQDDFEPEVTIVQRGDETVEEYRIRGKLYMVKVTPAHGVPYYLVDQRGDGVMVRHNDAIPTLSVPMWVIRSW
ncbi:MAG: DUF2782 domain-containing protein [Rhodocyclaceae bacterium]